MNDNEAEQIASLLRLAKLAMIIMAVAAGYLNHTALLGLV